MAMGRKLRIEVDLDQPWFTNVPADAAIRIASALNSLVGEALNEATLASGGPLRNVDVAHVVQPNAERVCVARLTINDAEFRRRAEAEAKRVARRPRKRS